MVSMKLLLCVDNPCKEYEGLIETALQKVRADYVESTDGEVGVEWSYEYRDLSNLPWEEYFSGNFGIDRKWIRKDTRNLRITHGDTYDHVMYIVHSTNWKATTAYGWSLGEFFNGYAVEEIQGVPNEYQLNLTFSMEIHHSLDDFAENRLGVSLEKFFGVEDYDEDITHGRSQEYEVFVYRPSIRKMKDILIRIFSTKQKDIPVFGRLLIFFRKLFGFLKPEPLTFEEHNHSH